MRQNLYKHFKQIHNGLNCKGKPSGNGSDCEPTDRWMRTAQLLVRYLYNDDAAMPWLWSLKRSSSCRDSRSNQLLTTMLELQPHDTCVLVVWWMFLMIPSFVLVLLVFDFFVSALAFGIRFNGWKLFVCNLKPRFVVRAWIAWSPLHCYFYWNWMNCLVLF